MLYAILLSDTEEFLYGFLRDIRTDDAELARNIGSAVSDVLFTRNIVEVDPVSVFARYDTLCSEYGTVDFVIVELVESG